MSVGADLDPEDLLRKARAGDGEALSTRPRLLSPLLPSSLGGEGSGKRGRVLESQHPSPPTPRPQGARGVRQKQPCPGA